MDDKKIPLSGSPGVARAVHGQMELARWCASEASCRHWNTRCSTLVGSGTYDTNGQRPNLSQMTDLSEEAAADRDCGDRTEEALIVLATQTGLIGSAEGQPDRLVRLVVAIWQKKLRPDQVAAIRFLVAIFTSRFCRGGFSNRKRSRVFCLGNCQR